MTEATGLRRPLVWIGRQRLAVPPQADLLDGWQATPHRLLRLLNRASRLVLLDPLSFPFEVLRPVDREVPVAVALPSIPGEELEALLGEPLLNQLGPGDRVAAGEGVWEEVAAPRGWPTEMRLAAGPADPATVMAEALTPEAVGRRSAKEQGRRRAEALAHLLDGGRVRQGGAARAVDLGGRAEPWRHLLPPGLQFSAVAPRAPLALAEGSAAVAAAMGVLGTLLPGERPALLREMWRVLRPGGTMAVVEDVVPTPGSGRPAAFGRGELPRLLLQASGVPRLSRIRSIRFPGEVLHRGAGMSVRKPGGAAT